MYFDTKSYLKSIHNYTAKHALRIYKINFIGISIGTWRRAKIIFDKYKCYNV